MIAMELTIELDIPLSKLLQAALPQQETDRETKLTSSAVQAILRLMPTPH
jgi:hypothetical protein